MATNKSVNYALLKKGGFMRQKQKGYFSLRLGVVGGNLTTENIRAVANVADEYGKGYIHMTSRQGIEIPFIYIDNIDEVKDKLAEGGVHPGVCGPRVRTVTACQGNEVCSSGCINSHDIAVKLSERYFGRELPHKFKFGVTGCVNNCLKAEENDFGVKGAYDVVFTRANCIGCGLCVKVCREGALTQDKEDKNNIIKDDTKCNNCGRCVHSCPTDSWTGTSAYLVSVGGLFGNQIYKGEYLVPLIKDEDTLFRVADAAINYFEKHANPGERFRATLQRLGDEELRKELLEAYNG
ncbi:MAG: 4Fe-4S binding protein [Succinivibrionaceae bacterium]